MGESSSVKHEKFKSVLEWMLHDANALANALAMTDRALIRVRTCIIHIKS